MTKLDRTGKDALAALALDRPQRADAEAAVKTLLAYLGEDVTREGLIDTPKRVVKAYDEMFAGYGEDPVAELGRNFEDVGGYSDMILVRDVTFHSACEHHMLPVSGKAHIAYVPGERVTGFSKLARTLDILARRLQTQETLTMQLAQALESGLAPKGVAILIEATHSCMVIRGIRKEGVSNVTTHFSGRFQTEADLRARFLDMVRR